MKLEYIVNNLTKYNNIRQILKEEFLMSDRLIVKLKQTQQIFLNNQPSYINAKINIGDFICVNINFNEKSDNIISTKMNLKILYEDDSFLIINKESNIPVHPSINHYTDSLSNGVQYYFNLIGLNTKIRPINRLDKNTSGIVLFAKNQYIQECLVKQMKSGVFKKEYIAIVDGNITVKQEIITAPIARKENSIIERCINDNGDNAITIVKLIKNYANYALVKCILKTGRTHQIRVHMKYIDHPILGDDLYGKKSAFINRQALHAYKVSFIHPITKKQIIIKTDLPKDIEKLIE